MQKTAYAMRIGDLSSDVCSSDLLSHRRAEGLENVGLGLIGEDVAVNQEEDSLLRPSLPEAPDDLESGVGLAGAGGHDQQDAVVATGNGLNGAIDGDELVVARRFA